MIELFRLKICFIAGLLGQGGAERQLYYTLRTLKENNAQLRLLCFTQGEFWETPIEKLGIPVTWVGKYNSRLLRLKAVIEELRDDPPDIIQSQHFYTNLYAALAARYLGCKEIGAVRNNGIKEIQANGWLGRGSVLLPRMLAANSRQAIENLSALRIPARKMAFLPNIVDGRSFFQGQEQKGGAAINLLAVGRLVQQKRFDLLIDLARIASGWNIPVQFTIIGDGPERENLEMKVHHLGVEHIVTFHGAAADLQPYYQSADILLVTSDWEGTPNVILEAMACGLPVVATKVGGIPEIVHEGETGFLAAPGDIDSLARAVLILLRNKETRIQMGCQGRNFVERHHSREILTAALRHLYERILN